MWYDYIVITSILLWALSLFHVLSLIITKNFPPKDYTLDYALIGKVIVCVENTKTEQKGRDLIYS